MRILVVNHSKAPHLVKVMHTPCPVSLPRSGAGRGSFSRNRTYRFAASLAKLVLKLLHVIQSPSHLFRCFPVCASWKIGRILLFWSDILQTSLCSMQVFTRWSFKFNESQNRLLQESVELTSRQTPCSKSRPQLVNCCKITRWCVDQPCICTVLATLLDLKVKHRKSFLLGSMTGHQTLKMLALTLRDVPLQR